ncbi:MAG: sulfatase [Candidatus Hydrogenedentes bacterium]|nr:sulfatase [Candidatus Hydrogenedentota bacterium]
MLRLSLRDAGFPGTAVDVSLLSGGEVVRQQNTGGTGLWQDWRWPLPEAAVGQPVSVLFTSGQDFWIGCCELLDPPSPQPSVLVYLIDTLRGDHLHYNGYARETSPAIDALARDAVSFTRAVPQSSWTRPSVASLLTSTYPAVHGAQDRSDMLGEGLGSLGAELQKAGYETWCFMSNPSCTPNWGFGEEFKAFVDIESVKLEADKDAKVVDAALAAVEHAQGRPAFFFVHAIAPHNPYEPPAPYDRQFAQAAYLGDAESQEHQKLIDLYDGEIAFTDAQFGRLIEALKKSGQYDNTLVVLLSDHGEEFWEHGVWGHGLNLFEPQMIIPLLVKLPAQQLAGSLREDVVELVDVAPTILHLLGLGTPRQFQGRPILPEPPQAPRLAFASLSLEMTSMNMARDARYKLINDYVANTRQCFDLAVDPAESLPLAPSPVTEALAAHADRFSMYGAPGLHLLFTGPLESGDEFTGSIETAGLGAWRLQYDAKNAEVTRTPAGLDFRVKLSPGTGVPGDLAAWHKEGAEQNSAHLFIEAAPDLAPSFRMKFNGAALPGDMLSSPRADATPLLSGAAVPLQQLATTSAKYAPEILPERTAVYLWYKPPPAAVEDSVLSDEMREALRALGYIH